MDAKGVTTYTAVFTTPAFVTRVMDVEDIPVLQNGGSKNASSSGNDGYNKTKHPDENGDGKNTDTGSSSGGEVVTDSTTGSVYEITSDGSSSTVTYNTSNVTNITNVTIPDTVKIKGKKLKEGCWEL